MRLEDKQEPEKIWRVNELVDLAKEGKVQVGDRFSVRGSWNHGQCSTSPNKIGITREVVCDVRERFFEVMVYETLVGSKTTSLADNQVFEMRYYLKSCYTARGETHKRGTKEYHSLLDQIEGAQA